VIAQLGLQLRGKAVRVEDVGPRSASLVIEGSVAGDTVTSRRS
jgi:hypothetical protein